MSLPARSSHLSLAQQIGESLLGFALLTTYLIIFTVGSQVATPTLHLPGSFWGGLMVILTYRETSVCLLSIISACLGTWRRINQAHEGVIVGVDQPWLLAYTSACIGGLITSAVVVGLPNFLDQISDQIDLSRQSADGAGPRNYVSMAMISSGVAFFSGYDKTFLDRLLVLFLRKIGLGSTFPSKPDPGPLSPESRPGNSAPTEASSAG